MIKNLSQNKKNQLLLKGTNVLSGFSNVYHPVVIRI